MEEYEENLEGNVTVHRSEAMASNKVNTIMHTDPRVPPEFYPIMHTDPRVPPNLYPSN